jgi:TolB protein
MLRRALPGLAGLVLVLGCGRGGDVDLGQVRSVSSGQGGSSGDACPVGDCANHRGSQRFLGDGVNEQAVEGFTNATRHPAGTDPAREASITYPSHETRFPLNVVNILHEWTSSLPDALFELRFTGPNTQVSVYTNARQFVPDAEEWDWIAESNRGGDVVLEVAALEADTSDVWTSRPVTLSFNDDAVEGAIYYWSTGAEGVMKALIGEANPVKFYATPEGTEKAPCVGCHTLSRDGTRMAMAYDGEFLREISVADRSARLPVAGGGAGGGPAMPPAKADPKAMGMPASWTTFSPDGKLLLVAAGGTLTLIDADSGTPVGANAGVVPTPPGLVATHPDWSANGDRVAVTLAEKGGGKEVERGSIALLPYDNGVWGEAQTLVVNAGGGENNFFPVFSPDSRYVAYVRATEKSSDALSAELRLVRVSDATVYGLPRLNQRVGALDGVSSVGNSMPSFAPSTRPGVFWLAFSSVRAYASLRAVDAKKDQLWIAAIDPALPDPGYPAFWASFQNLEHGNHRAFWTHTSEDRQCLCQELCGDSLDNDCDGSADEADCRDSCDTRETCGDGIDNDCNCAVDDCSEEICDDGIDNDGDGAADADDSSCSPP